MNVNVGGYTMPWAPGKQASTSDYRQYELGFNEIVGQMARDVSNKTVIKDLPGDRSKSKLSENRLKYKQRRRGRTGEEEILSREPEATMEVVEKTPARKVVVVEVHFYEATKQTDFKSGVEGTAHKQRQISGTVWLTSKLPGKGYNADTRMYYHIVAPGQPSPTTISFLSSVTDKFPKLEINWYVVP